VINRQTAGETSKLLLENQPWRLATHGAPLGGKSSQWGKRSVHATEFIEPEKKQQLHTKGILETIDNPSGESKQQC
jgi:hypothetical protein